MLGLHVDWYQSEAIKQGAKWYTSFIQISHWGREDESGDVKYLAGCHIRFTEIIGRICYMLFHWKFIDRNVYFWRWWCQSKNCTRVKQVRKIIAGSVVWTELHCNNECERPLSAGMGGIICHLFALCLIQKKSKLSPIFTTVCVKSGA